MDYNSVSSGELQLHAIALLDAKPTAQPTTDIVTYVTWTGLSSAYCNES